MKQKLFTLFLALVASVGIASAQSGTCGDNLTWTLSNGTLTISGTGAMEDYSIYTDTPWYDYRSSIKSVIINDGVTSIGNHAFGDCSSLTSITIPNSVTSIGEWVFNGCSSLTSITIPNSVTSIRELAFLYCGSLTSINVDSNNPNYSSVDGVLFNKDKTTLVAYPVGKQGAYTIPNSVTSIGDAAFCWCFSLTSITIPNSVTSIGISAFNECSSLTSITIPNSVTSIGDEAFWGCSSLTSVTIPNSVTSIGYRAFYCCSSLTSVTIPNSVTSIESSVFYSCSSLTSVTIPNSVTSIGYRAFYCCSSLTSVTIPNSVTSIGYDAFVDVLNIEYHGTATGAPWGARRMNAYVEGNLLYEDSTKTTLFLCSYSAQGEIIIPNSVTSIGDRAFSGCYKLTSITIPKSVTSIGDEAFRECSSLTSVINYATQPQAIETSVFQDVDISACQLYVPSTSVSLYQTAEVWKDFGNIQPIRAEDITDVSETIITSSENEVEITWPSVSGAASYELVIKDKDGNIVCTLIFNANGQLTSIAFNAPSRNGVPAQTQNAGFSFTITGLDSGTGYDLTLTAKDNSGNTIEETTIPFQTDYPEGIEDISSSSLQGGDRGRLILRDGQVLILRNGKTYTMQGVDVK